MISLKRLYLKTLYHGTTLKRWEKIKQTGLYPPRPIWLTSHEGLAFYKAKAEAILEHDDGVILEIDVNCAKIETITKFKRKRVVLVKERIPPECIKQIAVIKAPWWRY